MFVALSSNFLH